MDTQSLSDLRDYVAEQLGDKLDGAAIAYDELNLTTSADNIINVLRWLRDDVQTQFIAFTDICGVDYPERLARFELVYHLLSPRQNARVRVKLSVDANSMVPSVVDVFPGADWFEREAYDMYGIVFTGHPDLRRLLTDYGFEGYPLRKDFPLTGFSEVRYDDEQKRVVYEPVNLRQEFRNFDFLSPWEGTDYVLPGDEKKSKAN